MEICPCSSLAKRFFIKRPGPGLVGLLVVTFQDNFLQFLKGHCKWGKYASAKIKKKSEKFICRSLYRSARDELQVRLFKK